MMERWEYFAETAFDAMQVQSVKNRWVDAPSQKKISLTRIYYDQIHYYFFITFMSFVNKLHKIMSLNA